MKNAIENRRKIRVEDSDNSPTDPPLLNLAEIAKQKKTTKDVTSAPRRAYEPLSELIGRMESFGPVSSTTLRQSPQESEALNTPNIAAGYRTQLTKYDGFGATLSKAAESKIQKSSIFSGVLQRENLAAAGDPKNGFGDMTTRQPAVKNPSLYFMLSGNRDSFESSYHEAGKKSYRPMSGMLDTVDTLPHDRFRSIYNNISQPYNQVFGVPNDTEASQPYPPRAMTPDIRPATPLGSLKLAASPSNSLVPYPQANMKPSELMLREQGLLPDKPHPAFTGVAQVQIPDEENCALYLRYIPTSVTHGDIFSIINCGAVCTLHIYPAVDGHKTPAAKLIFMKPSSAAAFLRNHMRQPIVLHYGRISVKYNRDGVRRHAGRQTRVVRVRGPEEGRTYSFWNQYIRHFCSCYFELAYAPSMVPGESVVDLRFARVEGQSQMVMKSIRQDPALQHLRVSYGPDPCDPSSIPAFTFNGNSNTGTRNGNNS